MRCALVLSLVLLGLACDPAWVVRGDVLSAPPSQTALASAQTQTSPLAGAIISLHCPDSPALLTVAGPDGRFRFAAGGVLSVDCQLIVQRQGYELKVIDLVDVCQHYATNELCIEAEVNAQLQPLDSR